MNSKEKILDACVHLVEEVEGAELTLETAARAAGLTKPGLMYHFPTKEALMLGVIEHLTGKWKAAMLEALDNIGVTFEQATAAERIRAYVEAAASHRFGRADFAILSDAAYRPTLIAAWERSVEKWFESPTDMPAAERARLAVARLAADGLWMAEATNLFAPDDEDRAEVISLLRSLTGTT